MIGKQLRRVADHAEPGAATAIDEACEFRFQYVQTLFDLDALLLQLVKSATVDVTRDGPIRIGRAKCNQISLEALSKAASESQAWRSRRIYVELNHNRVIDHRGLRSLGNRPPGLIAAP
jgi:hypothetical protein